MLQQLSGDGTAHHARHGFSGAGPSATPVVTDSIFGVISVVRVARAIAVFEVVIVLTLGVCIGNAKADGTTSGLALEDARKKDNLVALLSLGGQIGLTWTPSVEFFLQPFKVKFEACRYAVEHSAHGGAMGFAKRGQFEGGTKGVAGHVAKVRGALRTNVRP